MKTSQPIGLFDSGVGGVSVWKEIHQLMPFENTCYLADSKNAPYGIKSKDEILELSIKNTEYLLSLKVKIIVVACNTATTNTIDYLRKNYNIPFIGLEPAIKPAALASKTKNIGVLATQKTIESEHFQNATNKFEEVTIHQQIGHRLVGLIEEGKLKSSQMHELLKTYITPLIDKNIDQLVLGCTHYPFLIEQLKKLLPKEINIVHSGKAIAEQTKAILMQHKLLNQKNAIPSLKFYTNKNDVVLKDLVNNNNATFYIENF